MGHCSCIYWLFFLLIWGNDGKFSFLFQFIITELSDGILVSPSSSRYPRKDFCSQLLLGFWHLQRSFNRSRIGLCIYEIGCYGYTAILVCRFGGALIHHCIGPWQWRWRLHSAAHTWSPLLFKTKWRVMSSQARSPNRALAFGQLGRALRVLHVRSVSTEASADTGVKGRTRCSLGRVAQRQLHCFAVASSMRFLILRWT